MDHIEQVKMALGAFRNGDLALARDHCERLLKQNPDDPGALRILGQVCYLEGDVETAAVHLEKSLKAKPDQFSLWLKLGNLQAGLGKHDQAVATYGKALEFGKDDAQVYLARAQSYNALGADQKVWQDLDLAQDANPSLGQVYRMMILYGHPAAKEASWQQNLLGKVATGMLPREDAIQAHYALAGYYEQTGDDQRMWENLNKANGLQKNLCQPWAAAYETLMARSGEVFTSELMQKNVPESHKTITPIFIVGLPRSGSTLLEQMLSRHPETAAAGETGALTRTIGRLQGEFTLLPYPDGLDLIEEDDLAALAAGYQNALKKAAGDDAFVTDKLLSNGFFTGFIRMILPWAKVIHIRRDPLDSALSIYKNYFWEQQSPEFCSLSDIGAYARLMDKTMAHWKVLLPGFIHDVRYEDLVNKPDPELKKVIEFIGLPWDPQCLDHKASEKRAETLSSAQVRKPLYTTSIGLGEKFEAELAPFTTAYNQGE